MDIPDSLPETHVEHVYSDEELYSHYAGCALTGLLSYGTTPKNGGVFDMDKTVGMAYEAAEKMVIQRRWRFANFKKMHS